ncbi:urease accessory protein UreF [Williamsia sterculiae]|uniref:Urease accessory protein n=1 Tax=Williamsia sterculiae TaxID=1344003 RepID=A0A1N7H2L5_9NOCA|nr:urease accessory UreF family protein [Williamsia sterculiae]SIS19071.1 urease accessory protein [Williamsia sterculiae]
MLALADSRLPVGGHVHSGGVEQAIADGSVRSIPALRDFLVRRMSTAGLVSASICAAVADGRLSVERAHRETDARTPSPSARAASMVQGRGMLRLARRVWPERPGAGPRQADWSVYPVRPHLPVIAGGVAAVTGLDARQAALVLVYTTMTGSATAGQRLLAADPGDIAVLTFELAPLCEQIAARAAAELADLSDPLFDVLAERHQRREIPLFAS